jgi:hypothetical protein
MKYNIKCFPVIPVKICEGGWQLPEVLRSYEECSVPPITGEAEYIEVYCSRGDSGVNLEINDTVFTDTSDDTVSMVDSIDITNVFLSNKTTVKWLYQISKDNNTRAGEIIATWNSNLSEVAFVDTSTTDIGNTDDLEFNVILQNNLVKLNVLTFTTDWKIKINREQLI